jgi:hypothetical protein
VAADDAANRPSIARTIPCPVQAVEGCFEHPGRRFAVAVQSRAHERLEEAAKVVAAQARFRAVPVDDRHRRHVPEDEVRLSTTASEPRVAVAIVKQTDVLTTRNRHAWSADRE